MRKDTSSRPRAGVNGMPHKIVTLRDYFAANASEEDIDRYRLEEIGRREPPLPRPIYVYKYTREQARYRYADAMLAAREVKHEHD